MAGTPRQRKPRERERGDGSIWERTRAWNTADGVKHSAKQYVVEFRKGLENGRPKRLIKYFRKKADAKAWWRQQLANSGQPEAKAKIEAADANVTLAEYVDEFLEKAYAECEPTTWGDYRNSLSKVTKKIGNIQLGDLTSKNVSSALAAIKKDVSPSMEARCRRVLHTCLEEARDDGKIASNPALHKRVRKSRKMRALTGAAPRATVKSPSEEQMKALLEAAKGDRIAHAMLTIAATCGLRAGELYGLHWKDIDWEKRTLTVRSTVREIPVLDDDGEVYYETRVSAHAKTDESTNRTIEVPAVAIAALRKRQRTADREDHNSALVFPSERGLPLRATNFLRRVFAPIREEAKLPWVTLHSIRHFMTATLIEHGSDAKSVSERLGHSDVGLTLRRYHHTGRRSQERHTAILDSVFRKGR